MPPPTAPARRAVCTRSGAVRTQRGAGQASLPACGGTGVFAAVGARRHYPKAFHMQYCAADSAFVAFKCTLRCAKNSRALEPEYPLSTLGEYPTLHR